MPTARIQRHDEEKLSEMRASVAARLKRVCDGMDEDSFERLVLQITAFKIKWGESLIYDNPRVPGGWMFGRAKEGGIE